MDRLGFLLFLVLQLSMLSPAAAAGLAFVNSDRTSISVSQNYYDDIRSFTENRAIWSLKRKNLAVEVYFNNQKPELLVVRKFSKNKKVELIYKSEGSRFRLASFSYGQQKLFRYTVFQGNYAIDTACTPAINTEASRLFSTFKDKLEEDVAYDSLENGSVSKACSSMLNDKFSKLEDGLVATLQTLKSGSGTATFTSCLLNDPAITGYFGQNEIGKNQLQLLAAKLNLETAKILAQSPQEKPFLECSSENQSPSNNDPTPSGAACREDGTIVLYKNSIETILNDPDKTKRVLIHEMLHKAGMVNEKNVDSLLDVCLEHKKINLKADNIDIRTETLNPGVSAFLLGNKDISQKDPAVLTQNDAAKAPVAQSVSEDSLKLPSAQELATTTAQANVGTDAGKAQTVAVSEAQSAGVLKFADQVTAPLISTPVEAATPSLTSVNTGGSRSPASVGGMKADFVGSGEKVVEEIDLDKQSPANKATASSVGSENLALKAAAAATSSFSGNTAVVTEKAGTTGRELSGGSSDGSTGGNMGGSAHFAASEGGGVATSAPIARRQPASAAPIRVQAPGKEELMTFFLSGDYGTARSRLRDSKMQQNLQQNNISIIDLSGHSYGAKKGSIILLDQGDRFVRQK